MPLGRQPLGRGVEQRVSRRRVILALEETEEADPVGVGVVVELVGDGGEPPDDRPVPFRQDGVRVGDEFDVVEGDTLVSRVVVGRVFPNFSSCRTRDGFPRLKPHHEVAESRSGNER